MTDTVPGIVSSTPTQLYIGGKWTSSDAGETITVLDPATGEHLATVDSASESDADAAVGSAHAALAAWSETAPRVRGEILRRAFEMMSELKDELARLIVLENGKTLTDAAGEVTYAAEFFRWYSEEAVRLNGSVQSAPSGTNRIVVVHQPIGVSVLVTPWNFPAAMATRKIAPALAAGCTVVLKPASETPLTALAIAALLAEAGVPEGVVNVLPCRRSGQVVGRMLADPRVRKLSFTGSTEVGRSLLAAAAPAVLNCSMELGGNAPFVVFDDADLDAAVEGAMIAKMRNGGEACTAANRFYVQQAVAAEFSARFAAAMASTRMGSGLDAGTTLGPLINAGARDTVASLVAGAIEDGAHVLTGGATPDGAGYFYPATVLADVPADSGILREEIFGPVAPIVTFADEPEAIALANDCEHGLVSYVYTRDLSRALRVGEAMESGMVGLNRGLVSDPAAPFGGVKQSGLGREGGHEGILEYTESKYLAVTW